jgi:hypothetical protein
LIPGSGFFRHRMRLGARALFPPWGSDLGVETKAAWPYGAIDPRDRCLSIRGCRGFTRKPHFSGQRMKSKLLPDLQVGGDFVLNRWQRDRREFIPPRQSVLVINSVCAVKWKPAAISRRELLMRTVAHVGRNLNR